MQFKSIKKILGNILFHSKVEYDSKKANTYLKNIINNVPHFLVWKDVNSVFLGCNQKFADSAGLKSPQDIVGKTDYDFPWTDEQRNAYLTDEKEIVRSGKPKLDYEETQTQPDGSLRVNLVSKVPMYDENNKISGVLIIYSDITERKILEENLKKAKQQAENANKAKSEFIRNISHDVRTPLAGIQQATFAISEGKIPEEDIPEFSYAAFEASKKLMGLFNQIIDVSKKEFFDFEDRVVKFDLYKLLDGLEKTYEIVAKHKGLKLEIEYSAQVPNYLKGKHLRLHRILMNLIGNALKFTENGSVKLVVEKAQEKGQEVILRFSVVDTGIGIAEEKYETIFEPFSRLNPSFEGKYPGSGLGLHVVKDYIQKMQGEIYLESEESHGSIFTCIIPFKRPILDNDNDVIETEYAEEISLNGIDKTTESSFEKNIPVFIADENIKKYKVLLVEDDGLAQKMGNVMLRGMGYQVDIAKSGEEAIEYTLQNHYDLIYMDVGLPGIDGVEATRQIRANSKNKSQNAFITALTAHADEAISKQCLNVGMQQVLFKPLTHEKAEHIQNILTKTGGATRNNEVINFDLWRSRLGENAPMLDELFHLLAKDFDGTHLAVVKAYEAHDLAALKAVTHKMKGALGYCGLPRLETAMKAIENAAKESNSKEVDEWYQETLDALDEAEREYQEWAVTHPKQE